ncbi:ParA family protein [Chondrinema litorale]|uniref:ParA family protein n=1 Tax=Chondrinema litorale TaxID=2994555 RepID=UPI002543E919|nr:AAA family ATPase [Chondrinema litorale]UZR99179.1 AAA family ATPase [Chondrinema litorale]
MTDILHVYNSKGGVGKSSLSWVIGTTLAKHLEAAESSEKVLIIDLDIQKNISTCLVKNPDEVEYSLSDIFINGTAPEKAIVNVSDNLDLLPSEGDLDSVTNYLSTITMGREFQFKEKLESFLKENYRIVVIDYPPNINLLTLNALIVSEEHCHVVVPVELSFLSLAGAVQVEEQLNKIKKYNLNRNIEIDFVCIVKDNISRSNHAKISQSEIEDRFKDKILKNTLKQAIDIPNAMVSKSTNLWDYDSETKAGDFVNELVVELWQKMNASS